jgi:hypothetical protein
MARGSRIGRKSRRPQNPAKSIVKMQGLALDMEELINEVENFVQALRFIGCGMQSHHDDIGTPISALARTAVQRLAALRETWSRMIKASAGA